jgi:hypothetical protein
LRDKILADLRARVATLEAVVLGSGVVRGRSSHADRRLSKTDLAIREGVSARTIERGVERGIYPPPDDVINGRPRWWLSTITRFEHDRARSVTRRPPWAGREPRGRR